MGSATVAKSLLPAAGRALKAAVDWARPDLTSPTAPLATIAWLDSFTPSLMPRTSTLQGIGGGVSILTARTIAARSERLLAPLLGGRHEVRRRLAVRAALAVVGTGLTRVPERADESLWWAAMRDSGTLMRSVAAGGAIHDVGHAAWVAQGRGADDGGAGGLRAVIAGTSVLAGAALWADRRLAHRTASVEPWPIEQRNALPESVAVTAGVVTAGRLIGSAMRATGAGLRRWLGPGATKSGLAALMNGAGWTGAGWVAYVRGVERVGASNSLIEAAYDQPPSLPTVSGGPGSASPFAELGRQGRRFVSDAVTAEQIAAVMGEAGAKDPVRVYVGMDSEPLYQTGRAELALEELERLGAYDREYLLLVSPTGTGWIDQTFVESAELLTRGDVATVAIQYGRYPSFLAAQKVALGRGQFRILLLGVRERLRAVPPEQRPKVLVFGLSMGAWTASDVIMHQGVSGFDHYRVDRALWVGLPWLAKWSRSGMIRGSSDLVPEGTVRVFDRYEQLEALSEEERQRLRAVILSHDNDPIAVLGPDLAVQRPSWLRRGQRGRGVPADMRWTPVVTFIQTAIDALNSMVQVPGAFTSFGHDYRGDMARFVHGAFHLPAVEESQMAAVEAELVRRSVTRAKRLRLPHA